MNNLTNTGKLPEHALLTHKSFLRRLNAVDWLFAAAVVLIAVFAQNRISHHMDGYEVAIL